ncbi:GNAT family N-acetyltransferase [Rhodosalinus sediminis]|uniref:GNAT family N-acetyltransferase n=1 Tax=Rhodosalinus sediminis TaxID=1940533 RepID=A0A3D9BXK1_9RHOB|nr:GNAT family N-acetyltransferase [Rhodosalinus sediminis]REC58280.1 GNAT family N-acetyltransferase [Rhodosalinus sediminis]
MTAEALRLLEAGEATWPPARRWTLGPWVLRVGQGGGKRVSAATVAEPGAVPEAAALAEAEAAMAEMRQAPLVMVRPGEAALDAMLERAGYDRLDPSVIWHAPIEQLTDRAVPRLSALTVWEPLQIMREIWAEHGVGPARQAVMERAPQPKTGLLARQNDHPAGTGFVCVADGVAMVHALVVVPRERRQGAAQWVMRGAAQWAAAQGAREIAAAATRDNAAAAGLYAALGMRQAGAYHYRIKPAEGR